MIQRLTIILAQLSLACFLFSQTETKIDEIERAFYRADYQATELRARRYLKDHPKDTRVRILLARTQLATGAYEAAYADLKKTLELEPENTDALYHLGALCGMLSQLEYQRLYKLAPDSARVHQLLAESYRAQEKPAEAEAEYLAALKANPRLVEVLVALGDLQRTQSKFKEAISFYSSALEVEPYDYSSLYGLGVCYHFRREPPRAIEYFRRALEVDPKSATARLALGNSLLQVKETAAALEQLKAAIALEPEMSQAYYLLGRAHQILGQAQEAQKLFKRAKELAQLELESARQLLRSEDLFFGPSQAPEPEKKKEP